MNNTHIKELNQFLGIRIDECMNQIDTIASNYNLTTNVVGQQTGFSHFDNIDIEDNRLNVGTTDSIVDKFWIG